MSNLEINDNTPQTVRKMSAQLRRVGWAGFWLQLVLAVVSTLIFLFAIPIASADAANPGTGGSLLFAIGGLFTLYASTYWSFRYVSIGKKLQNPDLRPKKADTIKAIQMGLMISTIGMGSSVMGAESIAGTLLGKSLSQSMSLFNADALSKLIKPLDIFIVLANTHTITAHFAGMVISLWLLSRITK
jgi:galactitol-specific phosphotransferase system IIB component